MRHPRQFWSSVNSSSSHICFQSKRRSAYGSRVVLALILISFGSISRSLAAQSTFTRITGPVDEGIPTPSVPTNSVRQDASALQELIGFVKASGISGWTGMQASGTFTDQSDTPSQATLTIMNGNSFRLDVDRPTGQTSTRVQGSLGQTLEGSGKSVTMPPATAAVGLLAFPQLLLSDFPSPTTSFIDRGEFQIDGKVLHRITVVTPITDQPVPLGGDSAAVTDLYFDPSTHLLLKSASAVQLQSSDRERYIVVLTYGGYQSIHGALLPLTYSETLNGQIQWTIRLNTPQLQPAVNPTYFQF